MTAAGVTRRRVVILGAAGRDFHNFNMVYRGNPAFEVVAFTAAQIEGIAHRHYPPELAGPLYPQGIEVIEESRFDELCADRVVDEVVFAYSDVTHGHVMHLASRALAQGARFVLLGPRETQLMARVPVIAVSAVRTGCGKSQTARWLSRELRQHGLRTGVVRHPMPYGDLARQAVQRFATREDLLDARCTIEEREEYEPHLAAGNAVYAGVDYARVLERAQRECDVILWDGGNNDFPFIKPDLHIVLVDALRPGHESAYHPGEAVLRMADVVVVAKSDMAPAQVVMRLIDAVRQINGRAAIVRGGSPVCLDDASVVAGKRVLVVEDGPTTTHGGMAHGAGHVAAQRAGAREIVDPRPHAVARIARVFADYPHLGPVLPAVGYQPDQLQALRDTINAVPADIVVSATPIDLAALIAINKPVVRARYEYADLQTPGLGGEVSGFLRKSGLAPG